MTLVQKIDGGLARSDAQHAQTVALVKTAHDSLDAKMEGVRDELKEDMRAVGVKVDGHEARVAALEKKVA